SPGYVPLVAQSPNLVITRTLSKSYSLAGIRFGFAVADPAVIRELVKVKDSYNCDVLSLTAATTAIQDQEYFREVRAKVLARRSRMAVELAALCFEVTPSHANFLWCRRSDRPVKPIYEELKRRKILVRYMNYDGYDGLRISVGTDAEIDQLFAHLRVILSAGGGTRRPPLPEDAMTRHALLAVTASCLIIPTGAARDDEPDDIKDVKSQDLRAGKDSQKRYFLIDPPKGAKAPAAGYGLIVVMP